MTSNVFFQYQGYNLKGIRNQVCGWSVTRTLKYTRTCAIS